MANRMLSIVPLIVSLAACSGSVGLGVDPPPPPPEEPAEVLMPDHLGLTLEDSQVVAFGIDQKNDYSHSEGPDPGALAGTDVGDPSQTVTVRYDAATETYSLTLPRLGEGTIEVTRLYGREGQVAEYFDGRLVDADGKQIATLNMPTPEGSETQYSLPGRWRRFSENGDGTSSEIIGRFVYGLQTPVDGLPVTGIATYHAVVHAESPIFLSNVVGEAVLVFDFGASSLSGEWSANYVNDLDPNEYDFGRYTFANTVFAAGSPLYSGMFAKDGSTVDGSFFDGSLTGPHAEEVIGRFLLPFTFKGSDYDLTGIWIGGR